MQRSSSHLEPWTSLAVRCPSPPHMVLSERIHTRGAGDALARCGNDWHLPDGDARGAAPFLSFAAMRARRRTGRRFSRPPFPGPDAAQGDEPSTPQPVYPCVLAGQRCRDCRSAGRSPVQTLASDQCNPGRKRKSFKLLRGARGTPGLVVPLMDDGSDLCILLRASPRAHRVSAGTSDGAKTYNGEPRARVAMPREPSQDVSMSHHS
ncbi:hypothetical protein LX36DRAFT_79279 [Colletotrichum falcatum]|nr:hypothetical protein LX36DRAFT_79279 [Colletotrichum falcatum]